MCRFGSFNIFKDFEDLSSILDKIDPQIAQRQPATYNFVVLSWSKLLQECWQTENSRKFVSIEQNCNCKSLRFRSANCKSRLLLQFRRKIAKVRGLKSQLLRYENSDSKSQPLLALEVEDATVIRHRKIPAFGGFDLDLQRFCFSKS